MHVTSSSFVSIAADRLKIGKHVLYVDVARKSGALPQPEDALIVVNFSENGFPHLTLLMVRPGRAGTTVLKNCVPHESRPEPGRGFWCLPEDEDTR